MLTMGDVNMMIGVWAKLGVKYPRYAIRWSTMTGDSAYQFRCPGWVVLVAPASWRSHWETLPEPRIPELSDAEFGRFMEEWVRRMQASPVNHDPNPCPR